MIIQDDKIVVQSNWDSGLHLGFSAGVKDPHNYTLKPLSDVLTKHQIETIEMVIATIVNGYLPEVLK